MDRETRVKEIVSVFIRRPVEEIREGTDLKISSVLLHRMYAALADDGIVIRNRSAVRTFGDLLGQAASDVPKDPVPAPFGADMVEPTSGKSNLAANRRPAAGMVDFQIGLDMEDIASMPRAEDYREDPFYTRTFSQREISYCILQGDPLQSFAGKFAAKEAIVKSDGAYSDVPLNQIEILNEKNGRPYFGDFKISISHSERTAVAVAIKPFSASVPDFMDQNQPLQ